MNNHLLFKLLLWGKTHMLICTITRKCKVAMLVRSGQLFLLTTWVCGRQPWGLWLSRGLNQQAKPEPMRCPSVCVCVGGCKCVCVYVRTKLNHLMNMKQHHVSLQDSRTNQKPFSLSNNTGQRQPGNLTWDLVHWRVPAVTHFWAQTIGRSHWPDQPFSVGPARVIWQINGWLMNKQDIMHRH